MIFTATCPTCSEARKFMEFKAEPCGPMSTSKKEYGFRCLQCKTTLPEVQDATGKRHAWQDGKHVEA